MNAAVVVRFLWTAGLSPREIDGASRILSADERERAGRFVFEADRTSYLLAHALLRRTLSGLQPGVAPGAWTFSASPHGKPFVAPGLPPQAFNLSHTRGLVACACATSGRVGIDVERTAAAADGLDLAERYFARAEVTALRACPPDAQQARFTDLWTLKEAYIKARGEGLSMPLDGFAFDLDAAGGLRFMPPEGDGDAWSFARLSPAEDYRLAVAVSPGPVEFDIRRAESV